MDAIVRSFPGAEVVASMPIASALPDGLIIPPGVYSYAGQARDCTAERVHSFWQPGVDREYRVVWGGDVAKLIASLAWLSAIGASDISVPLPTITAKAKWFKPRLLCGRTVEWIRSICVPLGVETRTARALTAGAPNGYFEGHVLLEAKVGGTWQLFDPAAGFDFQGRSIRDALPLQTGVMRRISEKSVAVEQIASSQFDPLVWAESTLATPAEMEAEWLRVLQIAGIDHPNGETWWRITPAFSDRSAWVQSLSPAYRCKSADEWDSAFYAS